jgi:hypothetical protein
MLLGGTQTDRHASDLTSLLLFLSNESRLKLFACPLLVSLLSFVTIVTVIDCLTRIVFTVDLHYSQIFNTTAEFD